VTGVTIFAQEYECSFASVIPGAYYTLELTNAEREGRVTQVDIADDMPVHVSWDLGIDDATALWCFQVQPGRVHVVDYYEANGHSAEHYCEWLNERGYSGVDWVPHDARIREWSSGRTRIETLRAMGRNPRLVPDHTVADGIQAARLTIPVAYFDAARCVRGLECLRSYCAEWDEHLRTFKRTPKHDWASHGADAFRYMSMSWQEPVSLPSEKTTKEIIAQMIAPRSLNDVLKQYANEVGESDEGASSDLLDNGPQILEF
jgi:phage terminase large subunit